MKLLGFMSFFIVFTIQLSMQHDVPINLIESVVKVFELKHPTIINIQSYSNLKLMKSLFKLRHYSRIGNNLVLDLMSNKNFTNDVILVMSHGTTWITNLNELAHKTSSLTLLVNSKQFDDISSSINVTIDRKVLLIHEISQEVHEIYHINNKSIQQKLGTFDKTTYAFKWENVQKDFVERRSNFHGITLRAMTETTGNEIALYPNFTKTATFFPNNETYLVTDYVYGIFFDVLMELQKQLNFTTILYKRKEIAWGFVYPQNDGTFEATGIVGDLFFDKVDMVVAPLAIFYRRALYIDYLLPLTQKIIGIYIPSTASQGKFDFDMVFSPFKYVPITSLI